MLWMSGFASSACDTLFNPSIKFKIHEFCESAQAQILTERQVLNKKSLMRLSKADDQKRRIKLIVYQMAAEKNDPDWKKIINKLKRSMNRGAWVKNPKTGAREYYKKHMYTDNAKKLYENGIAICPIADWNEYELTNETEGSE